MAGAAGAVRGRRNAGHDEGRFDMYSRMDEWQGEISKLPFSPEAYRFIQAIGLAGPGK